MNFDCEKNYPVVIDSDTGPDDGIAIMLAAANFKERISLCLSVFGNLTIEATTANFRTVAHLYHLKNPIYVGAQGPIDPRIPFITKKDITFTRQHPEFPQGKNSVIKDKDFIHLLYEHLKKQEKTDYIALGPLTNLALLLKEHPDVVQYLNCIVMMGGGIGMANITKYAEYNMYCDAQSAQIVFESGLEIHIVPLNTTNLTAFTKEELKSIAPGMDLLSLCINRMIEIEEALSLSYGNLPGIIYDAVALAYYIRPDCFETERIGLDCITEGERYGETIINTARSNVILVKHPDKNKFLELLQKSIQHLVSLSR